MSSPKRLKAWLPVLAAATALATVLAAPARAATPARPNILVIVADDMGYSDLGAFGGEIRTPNLDALAARGVRLTNFHTAPTCSPTRSMLLTGVDNHEAGLGSMAETMNRATPEMRALPGYEGYLNLRATALPERLRRGGYTTLMAGKWHLGLTEETSPAARGFDRSFALLNGGHDHYGDDQKKQWAEEGVGTTYRQDGKLTRYPVGRYSSDVFTDRMIGYLGEAKAGTKPFFAYIAYTEPHWPLQAPAEDIARYKGRYDAGYEVLLQERLARMKTLGLAPPDARVQPMDGVKPWGQLSAAERAVQSRKMEIYAAMVDHMDQSVGRVVAALKANGQYDNTVILFMSDNGAEGSVLEGPIGMKGVVEPKALGLDNSLANLGRRGSFAAYGPGWAHAAEAPSRGAKGSVYEGGIRTTAFVAGPGIAAGRTEDALLHVMDITPTALALAGVSQDAPASLPIRGKSMAPVLAGEARAVRSGDDILAWELFFGRAVRQGDWKAVYARPYQSGAAPTAGGQWALFNLVSDPGETQDLAAREPQRLKEMADAWDAYAADAGVYVPRAPAQAPR